MAGYRQPTKRRIAYSEGKTSLATGIKRTSRKPWISGQCGCSTLPTDLRKHPAVVPSYRNLDLPASLLRCLDLNAGTKGLLITEGARSPHHEEDKLAKMQ